MFGGPVKLLKENEWEWHDEPLPFGYQEDSRGTGVANMIDAIITGRSHIASGDLVYHVDCSGFGSRRSQAGASIRLNRSGKSNTSF